MNNDKKIFVVSVEEEKNFIKASSAKEAKQLFLQQLYIDVYIPDEDEIEEHNSKSYVRRY